MENYWASEPTSANRSTTSSSGTGCLSPSQCTGFKGSIYSIFTPTNQTLANKDHQQGEQLCLWPVQCFFFFHSPLERMMILQRETGINTFFYQELTKVAFKPSYQYEKNGGNKKNLSSHMRYMEVKAKWLCSLCYTFGVISKQIKHTSIIQLN